MSGRRDPMARLLADIRANDPRRRCRHCGVLVHPIEHEVLGAAWADVEEKVRCTNWMLPSEPVGAPPLHEPEDTEEISGSDLTKPGGPE
jgi:hypothetical protein